MLEYHCYCSHQQARVQKKDSLIHHFWNTTWILFGTKGAHQLTKAAHCHTRRSYILDLMSWTFWETAVYPSTCATKHITCMLTKVFHLYPGGICSFQDSSQLFRHPIFVLEKNSYPFNNILPFLTWFDQIHLIVWEERIEIEWPKTVLPIRITWSSTHTLASPWCCSWF